MMLRPRSRWVIVFTWAILIVSARAPAEVVWSGLGINSNWTTPANWVGGSVPANDGNEQIRFESAQRGTVLVNASQSIRRLRFDFTAGGTRLYSLSGAGTTLTLGGDGIEIDSGASPTLATPSILAASAITSGGAVTFGSSLGLVVGASQTWTVDADSTLRVLGPVSGSGGITIADGGYVELAGNNTYTGGTVLQSGTLAIEHDNALGSGALTLSGAATLLSNTGLRTIANGLILNSGLLNFLPYGGDLRVTGTVTLGANTALQNDGHPVYFFGAIGESGGSRSLTVSGSGAYVLSGVNTYTGGTAVNGGALFFANATSVPATGALSSSPQGYLGIAFDTNVQSGFIAKLSPANTSGTIGFDTAPGASTATIYPEPVNLSALNTLARLGSATRATLSPTAVITPANAAGYRFGGGGGTLRVESPLTGLNNGLTIDSSRGTELTVIIANINNTYAGLTSATASALVFESAAVSNGSAPGSFLLGNGGYIGTGDPSLTTTNWLAKFSPTIVTGVIGVDSADVSNPRTVSGNFDLSTFTLGTSIALGTASAATLAGTIALPPLQADYHFAGYKGGWLTVNSALAGARGVRVGHGSGAYPEFDPNDPTRISTVTLSGTNVHSGGTTLLSGRLIAGNTNAFGSGSVIVDGSGASGYPQVETSLTSSPTFSNQLVVKHDFKLGGANSFTWSGDIVDGTSTGTIRKHGAGNLIVSGNNAGFSGGFALDEGTLTFATNAAAGSGALDLGFSSGLASFITAAPNISELSSASSTARVSVATGTTLTINQLTNSTYRGQVQGSGGIAKSGVGTLRLETASSFTGGTSITAGTIDAASTGALGTNSITLNGATAHLKVETSVTLANSLVFGAAGGRLSGHGTFSSGVVLGTNSIVGPGSSVGTLTFASGLTLASGGLYEFEMQDALGGPGIGWDFVQVSGPLTFTATTISPFTLNLISLNAGGASGNPANFNSNNGYSWAIASATSFVGFNPATMAINTSSFTSSLNGGVFSLSTSGNNLLLNFTPVPEPSTWALLLAGLGIVGFRKLRRRR